MKQLFTTLFLTCLISGSFFAQTIQGDGGVPKTIKQTLNTKDLDTWVFDKPDITALQAEDGLVHGPWSKCPVLSAFPAESEVLFPPMTYLKPTGKREELQFGQRTIMVEEVVPHLMPHWFS